MERYPDELPEDDDLDLFGDPDDIDESIEDELDERLDEERQAD